MNLQEITEKMDRNADAIMEKFAEERAERAEKVENLMTTIRTLCEVLGERARDTERIDWMEAYPQDFGRIDPSDCATWREALDRARG